MHSAPLVMPSPTLSEGGWKEVVRVSATDLSEATIEVAEVSGRPSLFLLWETEPAW